MLKPCAAANGGGPSQLQSARLVAAVAKLRSLGEKSSVYGSVRMELFRALRCRHFSRFAAVARGGFCARGLPDRSTCARLNGLGGSGETECRMGQESRTGTAREREPESRERLQEATLGPGAGAKTRSRPQAPHHRRTPE